MEDLQSRGWLMERFGDDGSRLRAGIPAMLQSCHLGMAEAQDRAPMKSQAVYGQIWRAVHEAMEEYFGFLTTAQFYRPRNAPYKILMVNGTALFPWRYAHDAVTDLDQASLGPVVSPTRQAILAGAHVPDMLPFGEILRADLPAEEADEIERYRAAFRETATQHPVVVLAYASNPSALLLAIWGDVKQLRADGTLKWGWREQLGIDKPTPPEKGLAAVRDDDRPSFANAPLQTPVIMPRQKTPAETPTGDGAHG